MVVPVKTLLKRDLEWLGTHRCKKHGHTFLEHYECFLKEMPDDSPVTEKIGYFDIEASNLNATFGYAFSYCIVGNDGTSRGRVLTPNEIKKGIFDTNLMHELAADLKKYNRIVVFYGGDHRFDCPFVRARAIKAKAEFPLYRDVWCTDLWPICRNKLKLHSNRLQVVCDFFGIKSKEHPMVFDIWCRAMAGDKDSLQYIWEHNAEDCQSLKEAYELLIPYAAPGKRSI